jgi:hypothetical protein
VPGIRHLPRPDRIKGNIPLKIITILMGIFAVFNNSVGKSLTPEGAHPVNDFIILPCKDRPEFKFEVQHL